MSDITSISDNGLNFLSEQEGCILHPYLDSDKISTIGFGNTYYEDGTKVKITDPPITKERAISLFKTILSHYEKSVSTLVTSWINQNNYDALVSLCYNIGVSGFMYSTVLKLVNENPANPAISAAFEMWQNSGEHKGILLNRRRQEAHLYFTPIT